jgi:hypothetical protein
MNRGYHAQLNCCASRATVCFQAVMPRCAVQVQYFCHTLVVFTCASSSLLFLYEGIRNLFAAVDWGNNNKEGAARDDEAEFAVTNVAFVVWGRVSTANRHS